MCGLETIFSWPLVCRYMYQQTHGTGSPLHLYAFPGSVSLVIEYRCIRKRNKVVHLQQLETHWPQSSKTIYCFGRCITAHVQVNERLKGTGGVCGPQNMTALSQWYSQWVKSSQKIRKQENTACRCWTAGITCCLQMEYWDGKVVLNRHTVQKSWQDMSPLL